MHVNYSADPEGDGATDNYDSKMAAKFNHCGRTGGAFRKNHDNNRESSLF
jgi:hypothetical protein